MLHVGSVSTGKLSCLSEPHLQNENKTLQSGFLVRIINNVYEVAYNGYKVKITVLKLQNSRAGTQTFCDPRCSTAY